MTTPAWHFGTAKPVGATFDGMALAALHIRFPPDAPPGIQVTFRRTVGAGAQRQQVDLVELALAADEIPAADALFQAIHAWAIALVQAKALVPTGTPTEAEEPKVPVGQPAHAAEPGITLR